jgi:hypothetical protein
MSLVRLVTAVLAFNHLLTEQPLLGLAGVVVVAGILQQAWAVTEAGEQVMQTALEVCLPELQTLAVEAAVFGSKQLLVLVALAL